MALGAVRAHRGARAPKKAAINGARHDMKLFLDQATARCIRTFYPIYLGPAGEPPAVEPGTGTDVESPPIIAGSVKILAALIDPSGDDVGKEKVTLVNAGTGTVRPDGWLLVDKMKNRFGIGGLELPPGIASTIQRPRNSIQLANQGGEIRLIDRTGHTVHLVTYAKARARREGESIVF